MEHRTGWASEDAEEDEPWHSLPHVDVQARLAIDKASNTRPKGQKGQRHSKRGNIQDNKTTGKEGSIIPVDLAWVKHKYGHSAPIQAVISFFFLFPSSSWPSSNFPLYFYFLFQLPCHLFCPFSIHVHSRGFWFLSLLSFICLFNFISSRYTSDYFRPPSRSLITAIKIGIDKHPSN